MKIMFGFALIYGLFVNIQFTVDVTGEPVDERGTSSSSLKMKVVAEQEKAFAEIAALRAESTSTSDTVTVSEASSTPLEGTEETHVDITGTDDAQDTATEETPVDETATAVAEETPVEETPSTIAPDVAMEVDIADDPRVIEESAVAEDQSESAQALEEAAVEIKVCSNPNCLSEGLTLHPCKAPGCVNQSHHICGINHLCYEHDRANQEFGTETAQFANYDEWLQDYTSKMASSSSTSSAYASTSTSSTSSTSSSASTLSTSLRSLRSKPSQLSLPPPAKRGRRK